MVIAICQVFRNVRHGQDHKVINLGVDWNCFIILLYMLDMKFLSLFVQNLWPRLTFLEMSVKGHGPATRPSEVSIPYDSKVIVKVFHNATVRTN